MKPYQITIFIFAIIGMLTIVGFVFPKNGITIGDSTLQFINAQEFLNEGKDNTEQYDAWQDGKKIRDYINIQKLNEENKKRYDILHHKFAIYYPKDSVEWFDPIFAALDNAQKQPIRILHYGDSQVEEDRISGRLRTDIQERFGGYGVGMVPAYQTVPTSAISQRSSIEIPRFLVFGTESQRHPEQRYGPMGQMAILNGEVSTTFSRINLRSTGHNTKKFDRLTIMTGKDSLGIEIEVNANNFTEIKNSINSRNEVNFITFDLPDSCTHATVRVKGYAEIYGYMLDSKNGGVAIDNIPMRGCSGTIFTSMGSKTFKPIFEHYNIPLIILQYGGNSVPYLKSGRSIDNYCSNLARQIRYIKSLAPKSKILFIGPSDMTTRDGGNLKSYPILKELIAKLKKMCSENDVAYWDMYAAMGGDGSMIRWAEASPALAGADYVHFTPLGAERISDMLYEIIMATYDYYKYRNEKI